MAELLLEKIPFLASSVPCRIQEELGLISFWIKDRAFGG
jgi:hypothetical protein